MLSRSTYGCRRRVPATDPLEIKSISITSRDGDFAQKNNCPSALVSGVSCEVTVTFKPGSTGPKTASITVETTVSSIRS